MKADTSLQPELRIRTSAHRRGATQQPPLHPQGAVQA